MSEPHAPSSTVLVGPLSITRAAGLSALVQGDTAVTEGLADCDLTVHGQLAAGEATVVGGHLQVAGEATIGALGGPEGAPTRLTLHSASPGDDRLRTALSVFSEQKNAIETMQKRIAMLEEDAGQFNHSEREEMTLAMFDLPDHESAIDRLETLIAQARQQLGDDPVPEPSLTICEAIHPGVTITFADSGSAWTCDTQRWGQTQIRLNEQGLLVAESEDGSRQTLRSAAAEPVAS